MIDPSNMQVTGLGAALAPILAQEQVAVSAQLEYFQSVLLSPAGITGLVLGVVAIGIAFSLRQRLLVLTAATMILLTMMLHESTAKMNMLIPPLQLLRNISRPVAFALVGFAVFAALLTPRGERGRTASITAVLFLAFQLFYALEYMAFIDPLKGLLAMLSTTAMFLVCTVGLGRLMQDADSARDALEVYLWVGASFVGLNLMQLALGPSSAIVGGRLAGISGNAQQMGAVCALLLIANAYLFGSVRLRHIARWVCLAVIGFLALFILWSGSRTGALSATLGLVFLYRLQLGRFALLIVAGGIAFAIASYLFEDSTANAYRFLEGGNTRARVFTTAIDDFLGSPVVGIITQGRESGVESSYLRALAMMGMFGGVAILLPFASIAVDMLKALRFRPTADSELARLRDFVIAVMITFLAVNVFEGFAFGVLTFPAMFMYSGFAASALLADASAQSTATSNLDPDLAAAY